MARIDDYKESFRLASIELKKRDAATLAKAGGIEFSLDKGLIVPFLGESYRVEIHPEPDIRKYHSSEEVPLTDKILIAHYLLGATGKKCTGKLITFRQIPDGHFYFEAFQKRARDPFVNFFGTNGHLFVKCAATIGASQVENGDFGMEFIVFPHVCVQLVLWNADEEFPPDGTILFDESVKGYLPAEDIAVMSGSLVYRLIGLGRKIQPEC
ncbi:MAG: DUF3786 domain-containing protein [Syntrophobacteraceae bacterium]